MKTALIISALLMVTPALANPFETTEQICSRYGMQEAQYRFAEQNALSPKTRQKNAELAAQLGMVVYNNCKLTAALMGQRGPSISVDVYLH